MFNLFHLPREMRLDIYKAALNISTPETFLIFQDGKRIESFRPARPKLRLDLLRANTTLCDEACAVLYGLNRFNLVDAPGRQLRLVQSFLDRIGARNTRSLTWLCISFPCTKGRPGEDGLLSLELVGKRCNRLTTLEMFAYGDAAGTLMDEEPQCADAALFRINDALKRISSLRTILVRVYSEALEPATVASMEEFGWVVVHGDEGA
jgi:hypothetical protein